MSKGFRIAGTLNEFIKDLDVLKNSHHELIIWQSDAQGNKKIYEGAYDSYTKDKDNIIIIIKLLKNESFLTDQIIYIFEKKKGILFKGKYDFCVNKVLKIIADDRVFLKEKRVEKRFTFNYTKPGAMLFFTQTDSEKDLKDVVRLRDICSGGYSFKVSKKRASELTLKTEVKLSNIGGINLPVPILGEIAHISNFKTLSTEQSDKKEKLVGVRFHEKSKLFSKVIAVMKEVN